VPVTGLKAEDFQVLVDGQERPVLAAVEMQVASTAAEPFSEAAHAVFSNLEPPARLFVIAMNDAVGSNDPYLRAEGKRIAHRIVDGMIAGDRAAVVFFRDNRRAQDFTSDKSALRAAIERFNPMTSLVGAGVVKRAVDVLGRLEGYRRAVFYIGATGLTSFGTRAESQSPVPVYIFNTSGLRAPRSRDIVAGRTGSAAADRNDADSVAVARATGGRAILGTNAPADAVPGVLAELSSYYLLAIDAKPGATPGRRFEVKVRRPGVDIGPVSMQKKRSHVDIAELLSALESPIPAGGIDLALAPVAFAVGPGRNPGLVYTLGLPSVSPGSNATYQVDIFVHDGEGRRELARERHDVTVRGDGRAIEVALRASLRPGRYNLRVYVERSSDRASGSVFAPISIPDFVGDSPTLSGVAIGVEGRGIAGAASLTDILPFAPTALRTFAPTDRVGALWRVYRRDAALAGTQTVSIVDATGQTVWTRQDALTSASATPAGEEHRVDLPLTGREVGDYLLRIVVEVGSTRAQRDVRFTVR
jgi:hypothetical protein